MLGWNFDVVLRFLHNIDWLKNNYQLRSALASVSCQEGSAGVDSSQK